MSGKSKAGPVVTDNSNFLLDWFFDLQQVRAQLGISVSCVGKKHNYDSSC
jgi:ribose 5-phosphate isomerase